MNRFNLKGVRFVKKMLYSGESFVLKRCFLRWLEINDIQVQKSDFY